MELIKTNLTEIITALLTVAWVIVRLTPTKKDNDILSIITKIIKVIIPNNKKGGGQH